MPRSTGSSLPALKKYSLTDISSAGSNLPNRYGLHGVEGFGKTSLASHTPKPIFIQSRGETGLETLIEAGQIRETPHFPACDMWEEVRAQIRFLIDEEHQFKTLVIDTINGIERLMHEFICARDFGGDWGDRGFGGYQRGYEVSLAEWRLFLNELDELRAKRTMTIFLLAHTKVKTFKNPEGPDFDRYAPDMHEKTWGLTHKWLDAVFFGNFDVVVQTARGGDDATKKGKGSGGSIRVLYTQRTAAFDAKNRLGLSEEIEMGSGSAESWAKLREAIKTAKANPVQGVTTDGK
jgi:AAA domain-containing protein